MPCPGFSKVAKKVIKTTFLISNANIHYLLFINYILENTQKIEITKKKKTISTG